MSLLASRPSNAALKKEDKCKPLPRLGKGLWCVRRERRVKDIGLQRKETATEHATDAIWSTDSHAQTRSYPTDKRGHQTCLTVEGVITSIWSRMMWGSRAHLGAPRKEIQRLPRGPSMHSPPGTIELAAGRSPGPSLLQGVLMKLFRRCAQGKSSSPTSACSGKSQACIPSQRKPGLPRCAETACQPHTTLKTTVTCPGVQAATCRLLLRLSTQPV
ncbi:hypothetical protein P7K49_012819 [Saguinus oedipus]|uniref:Uncharacterized protein n=1 Tax=Saguinus oedipus TaxID=9490 RepID=A0ABQ9VE59_SAGOE|nr:hypothetical protein P7K49_012819 [Saguinus oedipus]